MTIRAFIHSNVKTLGGLSLVSCMPLLFSTLIATQLVRYETSLSGLELFQWLPVYLLSVCTMALAMTPSTFVAVVSGFFLGWESTAFMVPAYLLASTLGYKAGIWMDGGRLMNSLQQQPKVQQFLTNLQLKEWALMIMVRLSPVLPFSVMNLLMPALKIKFRTFLIAGFIGMLPRTLFSIWLGIQAKGLLKVLQSPEEGKLAYMFVIVLTIVSIGGLLAIFFKASRQILSSNSND